MTKADDTTYVFLDTNLPLHCRRANEIDWCALTDSARVILVVTPILLRELQEQAIHNPKRKLRERADSTLRWLNEILDRPVPLRPGVEVLFLPTEPQIDFSKNQLSDRVADDQLIASALELQERAGRPVQIATRDIPLKVKLKANARRPGVLWVPDEYLLPTEPDPLEQANNELRRKLSKHENRLPILRVTGAEGAARVQFVRRRQKLSAAEMRRKIREQVPKKTPSAEETTITPDMSRRFMNMALSELQTVERYNKKVDDYYAEYDRYIEQLTDWEAKIDLCYDLALEVVNEGSLPATDIDVVVTFPDGVQVIDPDELPKLPKEPTKPGHFNTTPFQAPFIHDSLMRLHSQDRPIIREDGSVRFPVARVKHGFRNRFDKVVLAFENEEAVRSLEASVEVSCEELPEATEQALHIVMTEPTESEDSDGRFIPVEVCPAIKS